MNREVKGIIKSERPEEHWGFLPVTNQVVLDLGCGINSEHTPTPWYFLQIQQATKVIGVDSNPKSYEWFKHNFNVQNFLLFMDMVDRYEKIEMYFDYFKPTIVKMDIEGSETNLISVKEESFKPIKHIAIEYHNLPALMTCETILSKVGYELSYYKFEHLDINHQGVIHGSKF